MKRVKVTSDLIAVLALMALGVGVGLVAGVGWALIVVSALILVYIILPDQTPGGPPQ